MLDELRDKYEVGASLLRESLSRLEVEGLAIGEGRRGFRVALLTEDDFVDLTMPRSTERVTAKTSISLQIHPLVVPIGR